MPRLKKAMITGITGQDGSLLAEYLLNMGYMVIGLKRRSSTFNTNRIDHIFNHNRFFLHYYDLNDSSAIYEMIKKYRPDEFYHLAAMSHVRVSFDIPEHTVDGIALGTLRILNAIKLLSPETRFFNAASSEMFGENIAVPLNEDSVMIPASPYACAKLFSYNITRNYRRSYKLFACSGITFNHESERRGRTFVTRKITIAAAKIKLGLQKNIELGNLYALRDWGDAEDYIRAFHMMLQAPRADDYAIATGEAHSVKEFLDFVFDYAGLGSPDKYVIINKRLMRPTEVPFLLGDYSKINRELGWEPKTTFKDLAKKMYDYDLSRIKKEQNMK